MNKELIVSATDSEIQLALLEDKQLVELHKDKSGNKVQVGEKRIYAPNFIYIKNGKPIKITEGISDKQKDSREELTDEILNDEEELFNEFFNN